ncbi:HAD family hydrolase [Rhodococcus sp. NPDC003348]
MTDAAPAAPAAGSPQGESRRLGSGDPLPSWREGATKRAILGFVRSVTAEGSAVPIEERIAVFDNDGTLWCEKPMPIQLDFILRRLVAMAEQDPSLRSRQPWQAACARDYGWLTGVLTDHYRGDDSGVKVFAVGVLTAFADITVEDFETQADRFLRTTDHPTLGRTYLTCGYSPMIELLGYLDAHGFRNYIVSGGGRDFMRPISQDVYGVPRQRVIGSSASLTWSGDGPGGALIHQPELDVLVDGPEKPIRIWSRVGRRPLLAAGNSNGDIPMLRFSEQPDRPSLQLLVVHDDSTREFDYREGAEQAIDLAGTRDWTAVSIKDDWATVFDRRG